MSKKPEPGVYHGIPEQEYFSWDCFSKSMIPATMRSAKHLKHYLSEGKQSDAMALGSLVDAMLLEPEALDKYGVLSETYINKKGEEKPWIGNSTECKKELAAIKMAGLIPIKKKYVDEARLVEQEVILNDKARKIIQDSKKQVAMVWIDEDTGVLCKGRIDCLLSESIVDLKTTNNASALSFSRDIYNFGYHQQAAMYTDGYAALNKGKLMSFQFIAVENVEPYCVSLYEIGVGSIEKGREQYKKALDIYVEYLKNDPDFTKGYPDDIKLIEIPSWALKTFDEDKLGDTE